jgi:hypothetical protein
MCPYEIFFRPTEFLTRGPSVVPVLHAVSTVAAAIPCSLACASHMLRLSMAIRRSRALRTYLACPFGRMTRIEIESPLYVASPIVCADCSAGITCGVCTTYPSLVVDKASVFAQLHVRMSCGNCRTISCCTSTQTQSSCPLLRTTAPVVGLALRGCGAH